MSSSLSWTKLNVCTKLGSLQQRLFFQGQRNIIQIFRFWGSTTVYSPLIGSCPSDPCANGSAFLQYYSATASPGPPIRSASPIQPSSSFVSCPRRLRPHLAAAPAAPISSRAPLPYPPSPRQLRSRRPSSLPSRSGDPPSPRQLRRRRRSSVPSRFIAPPRGPSFRSTIYSSPSARVLLSRSGGSSHGPAILRLPTSQWSGCFNQSHAPAAAGTARQSCGCPRLRGGDALISQVLPYSQI